MRVWLSLAGVCGFLCVLAGAFAAHEIDDPAVKDLLRTGALYGFVHVLAAYLSAPLIGLGAARARVAAPFFVTGTLLFSGSLFALAFGAPRLVGAVTPFGGMLFLAGWATLAWAARGVKT